MDIDKIKFKIDELGKMKSSFEKKVTLELREQIPTKKQEIIKMVEEL